MRRNETHLGVNLDWIEEEDRIVLRERERVDVGELGGLEGCHHLGRLVGVLRPVAQHLHPRRPSEPLLEVEVDGVVGASIMLILELSTNLC